MLVRWFLDAVAMSRVLQLTVISGADAVSFVAEIVLFGMPLAPTLVPWGTIARSWGTWEHKKGDDGIQAWVSVDFGFILGPHFKISYQFWQTAFCHASSQVMFLNYIGV